jgi:hypothetical protein
MTRTYLLAVDLEPTTDIDSMAAEILDSLTLDGIPAKSCRPWASSLTDTPDSSTFPLDLSLVPQTLS